MSPAIIEELKVLPCLSLFTEKDLELIGEGLEIKDIKKNDIIFSESAPVRDIFIVKSGSVKLFKTSSDGRKRAAGWKSSFKVC